MWKLFLPYDLVWAGGGSAAWSQQVGSRSRSRHEEWARASPAGARRCGGPKPGRPAEWSRSRSAWQSRHPRRRAAARPICPPVREVAEVELLLRRAARQERARELIPSLARTGEAPTGRSDAPDPTRDAAVYRRFTAFELGICTTQLFRGSDAAVR